MTTPDGRSALGGLWHSIQCWLLPALEDEIGALDERHRQFVAVCEMCAPQNHLSAYRWLGNGCPPSDRLALCKAYIAKAVWDFATTRDLIDAIRHRPALRRLCGWETLGEVPSEATFSRAFDAFARDGAIGNRAIRKSKRVYHGQNGCARRRSAARMIRGGENQPGMRAEWGPAGRIRVAWGRGEQERAHRERTEP